MRTCVVVLLLSLMLLAFGCSKDESTTPVTPAPTKEVIFALVFYMGEPGEPTDVAFFTSDLSVIPGVVINGMKMNDISLTYGAIAGEMELPRRTVYNYSVTAGGKVTEGSVAAPTNPFSVLCNEVLLTACTPGGSCPDNNVAIPNTLSISWACNTRDYFNAELQGWDLYYASYCDTFLSTEDANINLSSCPNADYYGLWLESVKGASFEEGATPNVTGAYGRGYVLASTSVQFYIIDSSYIYSGSNAKSVLVERAAKNARFSELKKTARDFILAQ